MTFGELQTLVSFWVDDLEFGYFTRAQVKFFLNNAQRELQKKLLQTGEQYYTTIVTTPTVEDQTDYILPSDFVKDHRVDIVISGSAPNEEVNQLMPLTLNQQTGIMSQSDTPSVYYIKQDRLVINPPPNNTWTMRLWYSPRVQDMTLDSETPNAPIDYHEYIAIKAAYDCLLKDNRDVSVLVRKLDEYALLMKENAQNRREDAPRQVVVTQGWDNWGGVF